MNDKTVLVTGGLGYIGSHIALYLLQQNCTVVIIDHAQHAHAQATAHRLTTYAHIYQKTLTIVHASIGNTGILTQLLERYTIDAVMHCAAYAQVHESIIDPQKYYENNVVQTLRMLDTLIAHNVKNIIFSSSCAVYGIPHYLPLNEGHPQNPISPYGFTKKVIEQVFIDYDAAYHLRYVILRYFNAAGAMPEFGLGEHHEPETHLIPRLLEAALYDQPFTIFGTEHDTVDGTCVRDYIHVWDVAAAHYQALHYLTAHKKSLSCNIGTGSGYSVRHIMEQVQKATGRTVACVYGPARIGDPATLIADAALAHQILQWYPLYSEASAIITSALEYYLQEKTYFHVAPRLHERNN